MLQQQKFVVKLKFSRTTADFAQFSASSYFFSGPLTNFVAL